MKCHYDVLGISMNATSEEIKKSYRKLALEWHPDKNLHRIEESKETFQLLQQAYEILIDPQERAWYDRHREEILRGGFDDNYKDNSLDVYQYFNTGCFKGYGDDEKGFYAIYRDVFSKIAAEDEPFLEEKDVEITSFGYSYSSYEEVVHNFYAYWQSYCTAKSFSWVDKCDLTELRKANVGRQVLRAVEKENKKFRDQHKKMRNEEVRQLVAFVRKRDKRIEAHKKFLEEQSAEKARKFQEQRKKQIEERQRNLQSYEESEWTSMDQFEEHFNEMEARLDSTFGADSANDNAEEFDGEEQLDLYCVACDKDFRSLKSMKNHENSKKHRENALLLKQTMEAEELEELNLNSLKDEEPSCNGASDKSSDLSPLSGADDDDDEDSIEDLSSVKCSRKKKKKKRGLVMPEDENGHDNSSDVEKDISKLTVNNEVVEDICGVDVNSSNFEGDVEVSSKATPTTTVTCESVDKERLKKKNKKVKDGKKKSKVMAVATVEVDSEENQKLQSTICERCNKSFNTRNKLFEHLKTSGHAVYKDDNKSSKVSRTSTKNIKSKKENR